MALCVFSCLAASRLRTDLKQFYFGDLFGKGSSTIDQNAEQLAMEGMQKMREKDYDDALKSLPKTQGTISL